MDRAIQLHEMQEKNLKEQIRNLDKLVGEAPPNFEYIKNVIIKYMETNDLPVL